MFKPLISAFIATFLMTGCAFLDSAPSAEHWKTYSGGRAAGDVTHFYWYNEFQSMPDNAADKVLMGDNGWYISQYRWQSGALRELIREGVQQSVPYHLHVRFNAHGDAVYQQYRVNQRVVPLNASERSALLEQANQVISLSKQQAEQNLALYQGVWNGRRLKTCNGHRFTQLQLPDSTPDYVAQRFQQPIYVAFLARVNEAQLQVEQILRLDEPDTPCMVEPQVVPE